MPTAYWPFAATLYCVMENAFAKPGKESAWSRTHDDEEFMGKCISFGAKVIFRPTSTTDIPRTKFDPPTSLGVFAGYDLSPGYGRSGVYRVWLLDDFAGWSLERNGPIPTNPRLRKPPRTATLELPPEGIVFPLKAEYDRQNTTLEGLAETLRDKTGTAVLDFNPNDATQQPGG